jgi:hypothetical protein
MKPLLLAIALAASEASGVSTPVEFAARSGLPNFLA